MSTPSERLNGRLTLYGFGAVIAGVILVYLGPPGRAERPQRPHPEDLLFLIPGWIIVASGLVMVLWRIGRSLRRNEFEEDCHQR